MIDFIDDNNILSKHQFGFRKNHSTNHAVIALVDKISTALDMGKVAIGCFIDLKKAFETVNHFILINKLRKYGIHVKILEWFISYLDKQNSMSFTMVQNQMISIYRVVFPKDLYLVPCYLYCISMIYLTFLNL